VAPYRSYEELAAWRAALDARNAAIALAFRTGAEPKDLAVTYGITYERIRQILARQQACLVTPNPHNFSGRSVTCRRERLTAMRS
jgi:hypothetical protein